jgi:hypothetical protein
MIWEILGTGADNGLTLASIVAITRLQPRLVRRHIQQERHAGIAICSDNRHGYYLAATEAEREHCVKSMRHRAREIFATAAAISKAEVKTKDE